MRPRSLEHCHSRWASRLSHVGGQARHDALPFARLGAGLASRATATRARAAAKSTSSAARAPFTRAGVWPTRRGRLAARARGPVRQRCCLWRRARLRGSENAPRCRSPAPRRCDASAGSREEHEQRRPVPASRAWPLRVQLAASAAVTFERGKMAGAGGAGALRRRRCLQPRARVSAIERSLAQHSSRAGGRSLVPPGEAWCCAAQRAKLR